MANNYSLQNIKGLQDIAKKRGLKGFYRLKKENLIQVLTGEKKVMDFKNVIGKGGLLCIQTVSGLLEIAKERGIKGCSRFSKKDLLAVLKGKKKCDISHSDQMITGLRDIAKKRGLTGYSTLNKGELIAFLRERGEVVNEVRKQSLKDLKKEAKGRGLKGYSTLTKDQLNRVLSAEIKIKDISHIKDHTLDPYRLYLHDLRRETKRALQEIARKEGFRGYSRLSKADLIDRLQNTDKGSFTLSQLRLMAEINGLPKQYLKGKSKKELLTALRDHIFWWNIDIKLWRTALNGEIKIYKGVCPEWNEEKDVVQSNDDVPHTSLIVMSLFLEFIKKRIIEILLVNTGRKVKMDVEAYMYQSDNSGIRKSALARFHSGYNEIVENKTDLNELYGRMEERILQNLETFVLGGSGWGIRNITEVQLKCAVYDPLKAGGHLPLPDCLRSNTIINIQNKDDRCFLWCILRWLNPIQKNAFRVDSKLKEKENTLNMNGIKYPVSFKDIDKLEKQNPEFSVNVFECAQNGKIIRIRAPKKLGSNHVNLLYIEKEDKSHYALIKNFSGLMKGQVTRTHNQSTKYCMLCLNHFGNEKLLEKHKNYCIGHKPVTLEMPEKGTVTKFTNHNRKLTVPFAVYADFECVLSPIDSCSPDPQNSYTLKTMKHIPCSFSYVIICFDNDVCAPILREYTGEKTEEKFTELLTSDIKDICQIYYQNPKPMKITKLEKERYEREEICWICNEKFDGTNEKNKKVRDHCHFTGKFRGAAHNECNLKARIPNFTPVYFHNLSGYDAHLFIKILGKTKGKIDCIPNNEERYISFSKRILVGKDIWHTIRFLDSMKFMQTSLDTLSGYLNENQLRTLSKFFTKEELPLVRRKGVFPYEYLNSFEKLKETSLPPKEKFYSSLNKKNISVEDYEHAIKVWNTFGAETLKDYLKLYNKIDVLLLADIFENFREICRKHYELDPSWYFTSPGLGMDAMLKKTKVNLELLTDPDTLLMIEDGIRGGISMVSKRYSKANNEYMGELYDPSKPSKYLIYIDANSLYPWAMSKPLPTHGFKWASEEELKEWEKYCNIEGQGMILDVDLVYPQELHDEHNDYPLTPEHLVIKKVKKHIPNLYDKKNYIVHHEALKTYLDLGLKLKKIHQGTKFVESPFMKSYIDLNVDLRKKSKNKFEEEFFKLMMNSVFGKTMENVRNRVDIQLVSNENSYQYKKLIAKPNYDHTTVFDEALVAVHMKKTNIKYNKPAYLGISILDISKMYDTYYNYFKAKYGKNLRLCYTDTDSFILEIETDDFYKDIEPEKIAIFDTSNYPDDHFLKNDSNKRMVGKFKDELGGNIMTEFVGLRAKNYAFRNIEGEEVKRCKGIKKSVIKNDLYFQHYKDCLLGGKDLFLTMPSLRSYRHEIYTEEINKRALSGDDDKKYLIDDKINTRSLGHYRNEKETI